jgi:hypothetical protein
MNGLSEYRPKKRGKKWTIERLNFVSGKWEKLPESWKQFKRGSSSYRKRLEDFHQLLLLLGAK